MPPLGEGTVRGVNVAYRKGLPGPGPDLVIVGGGTLGLAVAWKAAGAGLSTQVVDPTPGKGASWAAAGMLAPVTEVHYGEERLLRLNLYSSELWPDFAAELEEAAGRPVGYRRSGTLTVARDTDDNAALEELFAFQQRLGLQVERLRARECRSLEPSLAPRVRGGILVPGDHQVDNRALVTALRVAAERAGVRFRPAAATTLLVEGDRVRGVRLDSGEELGCGTLVLAAGSWSGKVRGLPPEAVPPVRPVKGQLLHLRGPADALLATRNIRGLDVYVVNRADGRLVVGASVEERGYDTTMTAGAVLDLLRYAYELLPGVTELEVTELTAGLRPGTPDNAPLIGPAVLEGLVLATGHYRNGVLLTPATAEGIVDLLAGGGLPERFAPFSPRRFTGATVREPIS
ncbi:MAG: glycine oxidase ThiO [Nitriliruptorales bacterium]|nr:glycine oxidase ThiO [Nitriliruptorales bacterium]